MSSEPRPSFGRRVYLALFKVFGPADVGPNGPPAPINPDDRTVPTGYRLQSYVDESGIRHEIAVPINPDQPG